MKKIKIFIKNNKKFIVTIIILMGIQAFLYWFLKLFQKNPIYIYCYLDDKIPFLGRFIYIYDLFYPFCLLAFYFLYKKDAKIYYNAVIAGIIGFIICDIIFLLIPTIMYRPVIPQIDSLTNLVLNITYFFDEPPLNCFPSIHCLFCFQVIYSYIKSKYNSKTKIFVTIFSFLIIISTLFVKQHFIYDVISAFFVCLIANYASELLHLYSYIKKYIDKI